MHPKYRRRACSAAKSRSATCGSDATTLQFEKLEDRRVMAVFAVTSLADSGAGSLRAAITSSNSSPGSDTINISTTGTINLNTPLPSVDGGLEINGPGRDLLTVDAGDGTDNVFGTGDGFPVLRVGELGADGTFSVVLRGLTLTGGDADGDSGFEHEREDVGGIVVRSRDIDLELDDVAVVDNAGVYYGGGIHAIGDVTVINSVLSGNLATPIAFGYSSTGSPAINAIGTLTIVDSRIWGNVSDGDYPASAVGGDEVVIIRSTIEANVGGGVDALDSLAIIDSTIAGNEDGGVRASIFDFMTPPNSTVSIVNSTISGNTSPSTGGVYVRTNGNVDVSILHSTIADNSITDSYGSADAAGGLRVQAGGLGYTANVTIENSIIAANTSLAGKPDLSLGAGDNLLVVNHSLIGDANGLSIGGTGNVIGDSLNGGVVDPLLDPLQDNGGPTATHALQLQSPALDSGDPNLDSGVGSTPRFDQRGVGFRRVSNGHIDMGAHENQVEPPVSADFSGDGIINGQDFLTWQAGFGSMAAVRVDGDADNDYDVDADDLNIWQAGYATTGSQMALTSTDEISLPVLLADVALAQFLQAEAATNGEMIDQVLSDLSYVSLDCNTNKAAITNSPSQGSALSIENTRTQSALQQHPAGVTKEISLNPNSDEAYYF